MVSLPKLPARDNDEAPSGRYEDTFGVDLKSARLTSRSRRMSISKAVRKRRRDHTQSSDRVDVVAAIAKQGSNHPALSSRRRD